MPTDDEKIEDIALIAGKEFRKWVVKDLGLLSQVFSAIKKRRPVVRSLQRDGKTIVSPRNTAASELRKSENGPSPDQGYESDTESAK
ncbi:hypothetical protein TNCV_4167781 [Trichonephila clavipes]|nr:hypothetical protein TNCV_4167781 [Trichonephila clavipes]